MSKKRREIKSSSMALHGTSSSRFAFSVVWSPIPILTWLFPFIGHMGICSSDGVTYDFAGPYTVNEGQLLFGQATRFLPLDPRSAAAVLEACRRDAEGEPARYGGAAAAAAGQKTPDVDVAALAAAWDALLAASTRVYGCRNYSLFTNNCHAFVAHFLNAARYGPSAAGGSGGGCGGWNSVNLAALVFLRARYTSLGGALLTWLPFVVIAGVCAYFGRLYFLYAWAGLGGLLVGWFVLHTYALTGVGGSQRPAAGGCAAQPAAGVSSSNGSH